MMSKHPLDLPPGRKLTKDEVAEALRLAVIAELDAINLYLQIARSADIDGVRKLFEDIAREEKTHVGEFLAMLKSLDPEQVEELKAGAKEAEELTGIKVPDPEGGPQTNTASSGSFEDAVANEARKLVDSARVLTKKLPVVVLGRGTDSVSFERAGEKVERIVISLSDLSFRFRVSQKALDSALRTGQSIDMPEATKASLDLAVAEEKLISEALLREGAVRLHLGSWDEPGASVHDVARGVAELARRGYRRPYLLVVSLTRYAKLLSVSEKTGVTDLERVRMLVDEVVATPAVPDDKVLIVSAVPEVLDVVYGGRSEVDYIGPEDGHHVFRVWSSIAVRVRVPDGLVVMEEKQSKHE
jgi:uncharacterized linocin/CFP29 family protein